MQIAVGVILGPSFNQKIGWGWSVKGLAGGRIDATGAVALAGEVDYSQCTNAFTASLAGTGSITLQGSIGLFAKAISPVGKEIGLGAEAGVQGTGGIKVEVKCDAHTCRLREGFYGEASVFAKVNVWKFNAKYTFWETSWDKGMKEVGSIPNPFHLN